MARVLTSRAADAARELRRLVSQPATPRELAERRKAFDNIQKLRATIGPIDLSLEELLSDDDDESD
jgi:hypothetical protein